MPTVTDLVPDVIDYLVAQCQASATLTAAGVLTMDGPIPAGEAGYVSQQRLWIGADPFAADRTAAEATQAFSFLGTSGGYRDETGTAVICAAEAWDGGNALSGMRQKCKAIVGAVEVMLRGVPPAGPGDSSMGGLVQWSQVESFRWVQSLDDGASAACVFHVTYFARLPP